MSRVGNSIGNLNLPPRQNESVNETARRVWNIYGSTVPPGAYNALDENVKSAYDAIRREQAGAALQSPGMFSHNVDVPRRPRD